MPGVRHLIMPLWTWEEMEECWTELYQDKVSRAAGSWSGASAGITGTEERWRLGSWHLQRCRMCCW